MNVVAGDALVLFAHGFLSPNPAPDLSLFPWRDHRVQQFAPAHHPNRAQPRDPRVVEQAAQLADR